MSEHPRSYHALTIDIETLGTPQEFPIVALGSCSVRFEQNPETKEWEKAYQDTFGGYTLSKFPDESEFHPNEFHEFWNKPQNREILQQIVEKNNFENEHDMIIAFLQWVYDQWAFASEYNAPFIMYSDQPSYDIGNINAAIARHCDNLKDMREFVVTETDETTGYSTTFATIDNVGNTDKPVVRELPYVPFTNNYGSIEDLHSKMKTLAVVNGWTDWDKRWGLFGAFKRNLKLPPKDFQHTHDPVDDASEMIYWIQVVLNHNADGGEYLYSKSKRKFNTIEKEVECISNEEEETKETSRQRTTSVE